jgi:hypothetical protein
MRRDIFLPLVGIVAALAMAAPAQAISLVVMATNTTAIPGEKVFTVGIQISSVDVAGAGAGATLLVQNLTFASGSTGPTQAAGATNVPDIQTAWSLLDVNSPNSITNGGPGGPSFPASGAAATELYKDSWWYSSGSATLQGINGTASDGSADTIGTVTTVPNQGLGYAQGPGASVGTTGYLWQTIATGIQGGTTNNSAMIFTGRFGPVGLDHLDPNTSTAIDPTSIQPDNPSGWTYAQEHVLGNLLVSNGGTLTFPLAQIVASGNVSIPGDYDTNGVGFGTFLSVGDTGGPTNNSSYNVLGGNALVDPHAYLNYATNTIVPEPSSIALFGIGAIGLAMAVRRRTRKQIA